MRDNFETQCLTKGFRWCVVCFLDRRAYERVLFAKWELLQRVLIGIDKVLITRVIPLLTQALANAFRFPDSLHSNKTETQMLYHVCITRGTHNSHCHAYALVRSFHLQLGITDFSLDLICVAAVTASSARVLHTESHLIIHVSEILIPISGQTLPCRLGGIFLTFLGLD